MRHINVELRLILMCSASETQADTDLASNHHTAAEVEICTGGVVIGHRRCSGLLEQRCRERRREALARGEGDSEIDVDPSAFKGARRSGRCRFGGRNGWRRRL